jgi:hypothetical protein
VKQKSWTIRCGVVTHKIKAIYALVDGRGDLILANERLANFAAHTEVAIFSEGSWESCIVEPEAAAD